MVLNRILFCFLAVLSGFSHSVHALELPIYIQGDTHTLSLTESNEYPASEQGSRHYTGKIADAPESWARLSHLNNGHWSGMASLNGEMHLIDQGIAQPQSDQLMYAVAAHNLEAGATCGLNDSAGLAADHNHSALFVAEPLAQSFKQQCTNMIDDICVYADLELIFDQEYQAAFSDVQGSTDSMMNMLEGYYKNQLNIAFNEITRIFLTDETDIYTNDTSANVILQDLVRQRDAGNTGTQQDNSIVHLVTGKDFDGSTAGLAYVGTYCSKSSAGTSNLSRGYKGAVSLPYTAAIIAHEIGHNFGSSHDSDGNSCAASGFVMNAIIGALPEKFSSCSEEVISQTMARYMSSSCSTAPVDVSIQSGRFSDTAYLNNRLTIDNAFTVRNAEVGFRNTGDMKISIRASGASLESVQIGNNDCSITGDRVQATCEISVSTGSTQDVSLVLTPTSDSVTLSAIDKATDFFRDTNRANSNASFSFTATNGDTTAFINADNIGPVSDPRPEIRGTTNLATDNLIWITHKGNSVCTATIAADGTWACTPTTNLDEGENTLVIQGGATVSRNIVVIVDTTAPTIRAANVTTESSRPKLSGTTNLANGEGSIQVEFNNRTICAASVNNGRWSCFPDQNIPQGKNTLIARAQDPVGNVGVFSFTVTVQLTPDPTPDPKPNPKPDPKPDPKPNPTPDSEPPSESPVPDLGGGGGHLTWFSILVLVLVSVTGRRR